MEHCNKVYQTANNNGRSMTALQPQIRTACFSADHLAPNYLTLFKFIQLPSMKKASQQLPTALNSSKETLKRLRSPPNKKALPKRTQEGQSNILTKHKAPRSREEVKCDSNNTTTSAKSRQVRLAKKGRSKSAEEELDEREVMKIINSFATKIQRQWKVHVFRRRLLEFMGSRDRGGKQLQGQSLALKPRQGKSSSKPERLNPSLGQPKRILHFQEELSSGTTLYDKQKYDAICSYKESSISEQSKGQISSRSKTNQNVNSSRSSNLNPRNRVQKGSSQVKTPRCLPNLTEQLSRSLERPPSSKEVYSSKNTEARRASFNSLEEAKAVQIRRHSTGELPRPVRSRSEKQLQIGKAYDIIIEQPELRSRPEVGSQKSVSNNLAVNLRGGQSQGTIAFKKGSSIQKMMRSCKKDIEIRKLRQLLSVENRYSKNEVTYRGYLQIVGKINIEHTSKLQQIKSKEGHLKSLLGQLLDIYKTNPRQARFSEDDCHSTSHLDVSLSFDKWDFNSSAKKSFEHLEMPEFNSSKVLSIESVLRELEEQEAGATSDEKRFKKNKSLHIIEAIAERSKEISDKDIGSFDDTPPCNSEAIAIHEPEQPKKDEDSKPAVRMTKESGESTPERVRSQHSLQCSEEKEQPEVNCIGEQQIEGKQWIEVEQIPSSHSLLITPPTPSLFLRSDESIESAHKPELISELIHREIITVRLNYEDYQVMKFRELVIEKTLMANIKMINSLKFLFARAAEERKRVKAGCCLPSFDTSMNAVNSWLLEVSHFVLDSYQQVLRDNLFLVRQPPASQVLAMARQGLSTLPAYETIPEYVYKDFEFYYIKTLHRNLQLPADSYESFSGLVYTYHRSLIDCLNSALMEELLTGRDWIRTPWKMPIKVRAIRNINDQVKLCLERSINVVSNWGEYGLGQLILDDDFTEEYLTFEEEKIKLVCREEILEEKLNPTFSVGQVMLQLGEHQFERELASAVEDLFRLLMR